MIAPSQDVPSPLSECEATEAFKTKSFSPQSSTPPVPNVHSQPTTHHPLSVKSLVPAKIKIRTAQHLWMVICNQPIPKHSRMLSSPDSEVTTKKLAPKTLTRRSPWFMVHSRET